jgi:hypothetical protein
MTMAKGSSRSKGRDKVKTSRKSHAKRARKSPAQMQAPPDRQSDIDGCDLEFHESEATPDAELPEARGGVEIVRATRRRTSPQRA